MEILITFEDGTKEFRDAACPCLLANTALDELPTRSPADGLIDIEEHDRGPAWFTCGYTIFEIEDLRGLPAYVWRLTGRDSVTKALVGAWVAGRVETVDEQIARLTWERSMLCAEINATEAVIKAAGAPTWHDGDDRPLTTAEQVTAIAARAEAALRSARKWKKAARLLRWWAQDEARGCGHLRRGAKAMLAVFSDERTDVKPSSIAASLVVGAEYVRDTIARADAAEKRLADLRAWAEDEAHRWRDGAVGGLLNKRWTGYAEIYEKISRRIDGKEAR